MASLNWQAGLQDGECNRYCTLGEQRNVECLFLCLRTSIIGFLQFLRKKISFYLDKSNYSTSKTWRNCRSLVLWGGTCKWNTFQHFPNNAIVPMDYRLHYKPGKTNTDAFTLLKLTCSEEEVQAILKGCLD